MDRFPPPHPIYPPVIHYGPAPIPLRKEPHIPLTPKTGMRREEIERRLSEIDVTPEEKAAWNAKYQKPSTGIPKTDLASGVQASLGKADTALQEHQSLDGYATEEWVEDQGYLTEHQDITGKVDKSALFDNPDTTPKVKSSLLPSYVDDVLEFASLSVFPTTGETGKIYVALDTNKIYRWGGTQYVQVGGDDPPIRVVKRNGTELTPVDGAVNVEVPTTAAAIGAMPSTATGSDISIAPGEGSIDDAIAATMRVAQGKQDTISDLAAIRSGAAAGATAVQPSALAAVATTGAYSDLSGTPTIPAAQVNADWNASSGVAQILNKPIIPSTDGPFTAREEAVASQTREQTSYGKGGAATSDGEGNTWSTALPKNNGTLALQEGIAPAFSSTATYAVGDYCTHEGLLYKCTTAVSTAGAWDAANWTAVSAMSEMPAPGAAKNVWYGSTPSNQTGRNFTATTTSGDFVLSAGNVVVVRFDGALVVSSDMTLNVDGTGAKAIRFPADVSSVPEGYWKNLAQIAFAYDGSRYRPISFVAQAGLYGYGLTKLTSTVDDTESLAATPKAVNTRAPKDSPAFTGTPTAPTANAGTNTTQIATTAFVQTAVAGKADAASLRYSFASPTPTVSGTAATVACEDRAINDFTVATGITSLAITPPAAVTGRARDFFCRVTLTDSSLPTVTLSGGTIDIGATEVAGMAQGVNLLMFTEIASGHWLASRRSAS